MAARPRQEDAGAAEEPGEGEAPVTTHETRPGRVVFTEAGNTDGWIATDLAVEPEP